MIFLKRFFFVSFIFPPFFNFSNSGLQTDCNESQSAVVIENAFAVDSGKWAFGDAVVNVAVRDVPTAPGKPISNNYKI